MAYSPTEEAIALLIDLAERGEINPWDVQVIDVIDRFLARMAPTASSHDLSESGQALLHAAMLVYLKAMALAEPEAEESEPSPVEVEVDPWPSWSLAHLDRVLQPRAAPRLQRTRPITLKELIAHLQELETLLEHQPEAAPKPLAQRISRQQALSAITQLAHPENLFGNHRRARISAGSALAAGSDPDQLCRSPATLLPKKLSKRQQRDHSPHSSLLVIAANGCPLSGGAVPRGVLRPTDHPTLHK